MKSSLRAGRALSALVLMTWTQACFSFQVQSAAEPTPLGTSITVRSPVPFPVMRSLSDGSTELLCHARAVKGVPRRVAGDTLVLEIGTTIVAANASDGGFRSCPTYTTVLLVRTDATVVGSTRFSVGRTLTAVLVTAAALALWVVAAGNGISSY